MFIILNANISPIDLWVSQKLFQIQGFPWGSAKRHKFMHVKSYVFCAPNTWSIDENALQNLILNPLKKNLYSY